VEESLSYHGLGKIGCYDTWELKVCLSWLCEGRVQNIGVKELRKEVTKVILFHVCNIRKGVKQREIKNLIERRDKITIQQLA